jgi:hypothetical protein
MKKVFVLFFVLVVMALLAISVSEKPFITNELKKLDSRDPYWKFVQRVEQNMEILWDRDADITTDFADSIYAEKGTIDTLACDTLYSVMGQIDTLSIDEMLITTVYIDSGSVIWTDYDDLSDVASYADTVFSFHKDVVFDLTITASNLSGTNTGDQDLSDYPKSNGTSPNIPYYAANDSLTATLIEYSASQTTFNQNVIADTLTVTVMTTDSIYAEKGTIDTLSVNTSLTASTLNTGQGDNELYEMNQNVKTTNNVSFNNITATQYISASGIILEEDAVVGSGKITRGESSVTINNTGCKASDYIFLTARKPSGSKDILSLYVDADVDSFIVYTDEADTLGVDLPFNWFRIRGK